VQHGRCQLRDTVLPTPVRLTRHALEGGAGCTLEPFPRESAGSNHDVRPAGAPALSLSVLRGHPRPCSATPGTAKTTPALLSTRGRDAATPAAVPVRITVNGFLDPSEDAPANHYAFTLEAAPVQVPDTPRRQDHGKDRQDDRQLPGAIRHTPHM
jgi:hypothetical protein